MQWLVCNSNDVKQTNNLNLKGASFLLYWVVTSKRSIVTLPNCRFAHVFFTYTCFNVIVINYTECLVQAIAHGTTKSLAQTARLEPNVPKLSQG